MTTLYRRLGFASLLASAILVPGFAGPGAAAPSAVGNCAPTALKYKVADRTVTTESENYGPVSESTIHFVQAGPGSSCIAVSFTGDARSGFPSVLVDVAIYLDGKFCREATFAATQFGFLTTTMNAVCLDVAAGAHTVQVKFRRNGDQGNVKLDNFTTILHYRK